MRNILLKSIAIFPVLIMPWALLAQNHDAKNAPAAETSASDDLENILDHLEKKMADGNNLGPAATSETPLKKAPAGSKKARDLAPQSPPMTPKAATGQKIFKDIQSKISEYDNRIEILESDLRRLRANVYDASVTDNLVAIEIRPSETSKFLIRDLRASLDGNSLYNRHDPSGLWMPSQSTTLFHGPLRPGDHQVDLSVTLVPLSVGGMKLPTSEHKNLDQSFRFSVPEGKKRQQIVLEISNSDTENPKPIARLIESEMR